METFKPAAEAFGQTTERRAEPGKHPDPEKLLAPFESEKSVAREFCVRCGMTAEVAEEILVKNGFKSEEFGSGDYLETDGCPDCPASQNETCGEARKRNIGEFAA